MGYVLKTHNRKKICGNKLQAKIVAPDHSYFRLREYDVTIPEETLSNQARVIRDQQQIESALNISNPGWVIIDEIHNLQEALKRNSYGSKVSSPVIELDVVEDYMDRSTGIVNSRPVYDPNQPTDNTATGTLTIHLEYGEDEDKATADIIKEFTIPPYSQDDIIAEIKQYFTANDAAIWNYIKGQNSANRRGIVYANLAKNDSLADVKQFFAQHDLNKYVNTANDSAFPTLSITFPNTGVYATGGSLADTISSSGQYTRKSASEAYALKNNANVETLDVFANNLADFIAFNSETDGAINNLLAFENTSRTAIENAATMTWTYTGYHDPATFSIGLRLYSGTISPSDINNNIDSYARLGWLLNSDAASSSAYGTTSNIDVEKRREEYGANDGSESSKAIEINVPEDKDIILKLPCSMRDLGYPILDKNGIGYYYDTAAHGYTEDMYNYKIEIVGNAKAFMKDTMPQYTDTIAPTSSSDYKAIFENGTGFYSTNIKRYVCIAKEDITQGDQISVRFTALAKNIYYGQLANIPIHVLINVVAASAS